MQPMRIERAVLAAAFILLPGLMLAPVWQRGGLGAGEDDVLYYYPSRVQFQRFVQSGAAPWIQPWTGLGRPYLADPQSAVFYPPTWLFAFLDARTAYPASLWLHYSLAMLGGYRLLRHQGLKRSAAFFGGCAFAFSGFMLAHRAHFAMVHAAAWLPWVLWRLRRYVETGSPAHAALAATLAALQCFCGHVQIAALTGLGGLVYLLGATDVPRWRMALRWASVWGLAAGLFAVQWMPTAIYVAETSRGQHGYLDFVENSWWPQSALGWVMPMLYGQRTPNLFPHEYWGPSHQVEQFAYPGIAPLVLAFAALRPERRPHRHIDRWRALLIFSGLLALGLFGPICPVLYWLPGANLFRVPARALVLLNLALAALAAHSFHDLLRQPTPQRARLRAALLSLCQRPIRVALLTVVVILVLVGLASPFLLEHARDQALRVLLRPWNPAVWVPLAAISGSLAAIGFAARRWDRPAWLGGVLAVSLVDLGVIGWTIDVPAGPESESPAALLEPAEREEWLRFVRGSSERLWVVAVRDSVGRPGEYVNSVARGVANTNILDEIQALTDYGPLQPRHWRERFGFRPWGECERPDELLAAGRALRRLNVGWVLLCSDTLTEPDGGRRVVTTRSGWRLFRLEGGAGSAYLDDPSEAAAIDVRESAPSRFTVVVHRGSPGRSASGPARLVASRLWTGGWSATVNGQPAAIERTDELLMAVTLSGSEPSEVQWHYWPPGLTAGAFVSGLTGLVLLVWAMFGHLSPNMNWRKSVFSSIPN